MPFLRTTFLSALSLVSQTISTAATGTACDCYETSAGDFFDTHQFLDFRNGKPANFDEFFHILAVDNYKGNTVNNDMVAANVAFKDGDMSLLTINDGSGTQKSADMYSNPSMLYGSFRMHALITGAPGAVAGFFTFLDAFNEQDIEILTDEGHSQIHYTTHDNGGTGNGNPTLNTTLAGGGSWTDYNTHRFDWIPSKASFYANDAPVKEITTAVPTKPCTLNVNMWSSGDQWGGPMAVGRSATLAVQWIEAVYNASAPAAASSSRVRRGAANGASSRYEARQTGGCERVCKVDGVAEVGTPEAV